MTNVSLKQLAQLSENLNEASDNLSKQILHTEGALNELKLGIWAWVELYRSEVEIAGATEIESESIGYGKHHGKWGFLYKTEVLGLPPEHFTSVVLLRDAPRMERIHAVDKLPRLVQALEARAREVTQMAQTKATELASYTKELEASLK